MAIPDYKTKQTTQEIEIEPKDVHKHLSKHILVDGFHYVMDLQKSHGSYIHDASTGISSFSINFARKKYFPSKPVSQNSYPLS